MKTLSDETFDKLLVLAKLQTAKDLPPIDDLGYTIGKTDGEIILARQILEDLGYDWTAE